MIFNYYGVDWLAMALTFLAIWQLGNKNKMGFIVMMLGNLSWVGLGILSHSIAMVIANIAFLLMNLRALAKWSKPGSIP